MGNGTCSSLHRLKRWQGTATGKSRKYVNEPGFLYQRNRGILRELQGPSGDHDFHVLRHSNNIVMQCTQHRLGTPSPHTLNFNCASSHPDESTHWAIKCSLPSKTPSLVYWWHRAREYSFQTEATTGLPEVSPSASAASREHGHCFPLLCTDAHLSYCCRPVISLAALRLLCCAPIPVNTHTLCAATAVSCHISAPAHTGARKLPVLFYTNHF